MDLELVGKTCLVAGASRGIGRAIALALTREGGRICGVARGKADLDALEVEAKVVADVATAEGAHAAVEGAVAALGGLDIVVTNVGKSFARDAASMDDADFGKSLDTNLWTAARVAQRAVPHLTATHGALHPAASADAVIPRQRGDKSIIMVASIWGREAGGAPGYNVAKAGVVALAKALARDYGKLGIRVNSVAPGSIWFPGGGWDRRMNATPEIVQDMVKRELPFGRFGTPDEVADVVTFLASPRASWISGSCLVVDGGQSRSF